MRALLIMLALAGCDASPDGYRFEQSEFERKTVIVTTITHPNAGDLRLAAAIEGVKVEPGHKLMAFGIVSKSEPRCTIHMVEPANKYQPHWIGHEFTHCIRGRWHS